MEIERERRGEREREIGRQTVRERAQIHLGSGLPQNKNKKYKQNVIQNKRNKKSVNDIVERGEGGRREGRGQAITHEGAF